MKILIIVTILSQVAFADTFNVALPMLPKINPITNQVNVGTYLGTHLYYPLFEFKPGSAGFESYFLESESTKAVDKQFKVFDFCLKSGVKFSDGSYVEAKDLRDSLISFAKMYPQVMEIQKSKYFGNHCVEITLKNSTAGLFRKLTGIASTIIRNGDDVTPFPLGVGPYKIKSMNSSSVNLIYSGGEKIRFSEIKFEQIKKEEFDFSKFQDLNQMPPNSKRDLQLSGNKIDIPSLKVYTMILNIKNSEKRRRFSARISKVDWADVFNLSVTKSSNFLPWNTVGKARTVEMKNHSIKFDTKLETVDFVVPDFYSVDRVKSFLALAKLEKYFKIQYVPAEKYVEWAFSGKEYVSLMGFDSSGSVSSLEGDFSTYFESFYSPKNRIVTDKLSSIENLMRRASKVQSESLRADMMSQAEKYLVENNFVFPIGRVKRSFIFSNGITINEWYDFYSGIPKISRIN